MDTHSEPKEPLMLCNRALGHCLLPCPGLLWASLALGTLSSAFLARNLPDTLRKPISWPSVCWCSSVPVTFLPVFATAPQGQGHGGCGDYLHLGLQAGPWSCYLCPKVLHYPPKTWEELSERFSIKQILREICIQVLSHSQLLRLAFETHTR